MSALKDEIRLRFPRALAFYQRRVAPLILRERRHLELSDWATKGEQIVASTGMYGIRFERDGIWVDDGHGFLWAYTPGIFMSALGAEFGLRYEHREIELLAERLPAGGLLVDVGANAGLHSVQLARMVDRLRVLAFEPVRQTYEVLKRNVAKNGVAESVEPLHMALDDHPGTLRLTTQFHVGNFVVPEGTTTAQGVTEEVVSRPLDDVLADREGSVDAIKCDVEGAELGVLRGASKTIERDHPLILIEIDERWAGRYGHTGAEVVDFLRDRGYGYECLVDDQLRPPSDDLAADLAAGRNFLFTRI